MFSAAPKHSVVALVAPSYYFVHTSDQDREMLIIIIKYQMCAYTGQYKKYYMIQFVMFRWMLQLQLVWHSTSLKN
jgi:proteasome assembly chaperone (PAC2) family protein